MPNNRKGMLYIAYQNNIDVQKIQKRITYLKIKEWLYLGEDSTWRVHAEAAIPKEISRISIADLLDEMSHKIRHEYIDWIGSLSQTNASLEWWSSELAAKNPYHFFYVRICLLASAKKIISRGFDTNTLMICSTPALLESVTRYANEKGIAWRYLHSGGSLPHIGSLKQNTLRTLEKIAQVFPVFPKAGQYICAYQRFLEKDLRYRRQVLSEYNVKIPPGFSGKNTVLFFTWVDRRNFIQDSVYTDTHFGPLPQMLKDRGYRVAFVPRVLFTLPFEEAVQKLIETNETFFFPEQYITQHDVTMAKKRQDKFNPVIPESASIDGIPLYALTNEHISQTKEFISENLLFEPLMASMHKKGVEPYQIIHTCEGQSWEQALSWSVHRFMPATKVIGYDNVTFSRLVLSMYPAKNEYGIRPIPDRVVTNGPLYRDVLLKEGLPRTTVRAGCALRHIYLWKYAHDEKELTMREAPARPVRILVATAIGLGDSVELVAKASDAFGGDLRYEVIIKCHPLVDPEEVKKYLGNKIQTANIRFEKISINELLPAAHILLYTYTSVCYEAMMYGVFPVCVKAENFLNLDKLDANPDIRWMVTSPEDLRNAVEEIVSLSPENRKVWRMKASEIVRQALSPVDDQCVKAFVFDEVA